MANATGYRESGADAKSQLEAKLGHTDVRNASSSIAVNCTELFSLNFTGSIASCEPTSARSFSQDAYCFRLVGQHRA